MKLQIAAAAPMAIKPVRLRRSRCAADRQWISAGYWQRHKQAT
jgi:hypothetical protein